MSREFKTVTRGKVTPDQKEALYVLANTKGGDRRYEALVATGLDHVPMQPLVDSGVVSVTKDGQLRLRPEGRLVAAERLTPERQKAFNDFISGSFVGSTAAKSAEEKIEERSKEISERELARRAALAVEETKSDWVRSVIRKSKPKRGDNYGAIKSKLNRLESVSLRQRSGFDEELKEDFYDMYERLRVLMLLQKKRMKAKGESDKEIIDAQIDAVFDLVKNPPEDDDARRRMGRDKMLAKFSPEGARDSRAAQERIRKKIDLGRASERERIREMPPHDAAVYKVRQLMDRFIHQKEMFEAGNKKKMPSAGIIKGDRGALGILSEERDRLSRSDEPEVKKKIKDVDLLTQEAMSLVGLAPDPRELALTPEGTFAPTLLTPGTSLPDSSRAISRPMTHRRYGKYTIHRGLPRYDIPTEDLIRAKEDLQEALASDSKIQEEKFKDMHSGRKSLRGKRLAGSIYGADPLFALHDNKAYRALWNEMKELLERKRSQGGGSLTEEREQRLKKVESDLNKMRARSIEGRTKIVSPAVNRTAQETLKEILRELEDRKRILFERHYQDVISQRAPRIKAARDYLENLADRIDGMKPGAGARLKEQFAKLRGEFLLAMDAAGQKDLVQKRKSLELILSQILKNKAETASSLAQAREDYASILKSLDSQNVPDVVRRKRLKQYISSIEEKQEALKSIEKQEASIKNSLNRLSVDSMARVTSREGLIAGLPQAGAETGLTTVGSRIMEAVATGVDPLSVTDELLSQQAKPEYLRELDQFATAMVKKGKDLEERGVKEILEEKRRSEKARDVERRSDVAKLEEQREKLESALDQTYDPDKINKIKEVISTLSAQIAKLRSGEILPSAFEMNVFREVGFERGKLLEINEIELKIVRANIKKLIEGRELNLKRKLPDGSSRSVSVKKVPDSELESARIDSAKKAGIGNEVQSMIESGAAFSAENAIAMLMEEIKRVERFSSVYQAKAIEIVNRFTELDNKVEASIAHIDKYNSLVSELEELNSNIKDIEKKLKRTSAGGFPPAELMRVLDDLRMRRRSIGEELVGIPSPLQKRLSPLLDAPSRIRSRPDAARLTADVIEIGGFAYSLDDITGERRTITIPKDRGRILETSEYEEYKKLKPQYEKIVARALADEQFALIRPTQDALPVAIDRDRQRRLEGSIDKAAKEGKSIPLASTPLVNESQINDYKSIFKSTNAYKEDLKYRIELDRLINRENNLFSKIRYYSKEIEIDGVKYTFTSLDSYKVPAGFLGSPEYGDLDPALAKRQATSRAEGLVSLLSHQTTFNRASRLAIKRYKRLAFESQNKRLFKKDLSVAFAPADPVPSADALMAMGQLISRFDSIDSEVFSLPQAPPGEYSSMSTIDTKLGGILTSIKQSILIMVHEGVELDIEGILKTDGRLSQYDDIVRKSGEKSEERFQRLVSVLSTIDSNFESLKDRASEIIETKNVNNGDGEDGSQIVSVDNFVRKDYTFQRAQSYEDRFLSGKESAIRWEDQRVFILARMSQDREIIKSAKKLEKEREQERKNREDYEAKRERMGLAEGERLHVVPTRFGESKKRAFLPGSLHMVIPVIKSKSDFDDRYGGFKVNKREIVKSDLTGLNGTREMIALSAQLYRHSPPLPDEFELMVEVSKDRSSIVAVYVQSQEAEDYLYKKPAAKGFSPTGLIPMLEERISLYEKSVAEGKPIQLWDRHAEAYIKMTMTESPRAPIIKRIKKQDKLGDRAYKAMDKKAIADTIENIRGEASRIQLMSEAEFDSEFPANKFEKISVPSRSNPVMSRIDPDRIKRYKSSPVVKDGKILRLVAPLNVPTGGDNRAMLARYYAVQLKNLFTKEVLSKPKVLESLISPRPPVAEEVEKRGVEDQSKYKGDIIWPRLAQLLVVNHKDKSVGLYVVFPKRVEITEKPEVDQMIKMLLSNEALAEYEITRARVAAGWVADYDNQPRKWDFAISQAINYRPTKNPGNAAAKIDPSKYVFVEFVPMFGSSKGSGSVKEFRLSGETERSSGYSGFKKMMNRGIDYDFFAIPKGKVSTKYIRYNKPYCLRFDGEKIFVEDSGEQIKPFVRLSPQGKVRPKSVTGLPRSRHIKHMALEGIRRLGLNPSSLNEYVKREQSTPIKNPTPPEIADLKSRLDLYKKNQDGRTLRALVKKVQSAKNSPDQRVSKAAHKMLRELRRK